MSSNDVGIGMLAHTAAGEFVRKVRKNCNFHALPHWLQDNDFLHHGHRPPTNSFWACLKSIFRVHTETVNIWTHLLGKIIFCYYRKMDTWNNTRKYDESDRIDHFKI